MIQVTSSHITHIHMPSYKRCTHCQLLHTAMCTQTHNICKAPPHTCAAINSAQRTENSARHHIQICV